MTKLCPLGRVVRIGNSLSERTNPNYHDEKLIRAAEDLSQLDECWHEEFLKSFDSKDREFIRCRVKKLEERL